MDDMISSDSHIIEPPDLWTERVDARFRDRAPRIVREDDGDFWYIDGQRSMSFLGVQTGDRFEKDATELVTVARFEDVRPASYDPARYVEENRKDGIVGSVVYPSEALLAYSIPDPALCSATMRAYNDFIAEFCTHDPARLKGIALVNVDDPAEAVAEMQRARRLGLEGIMITVLPPADRAYDHPMYEPVWAAAVDLDLPISMHVATGRSALSASEKQTSLRTGVTEAAFYLQDHFVRKSIGEMIFSGVFMRHPKLRVGSIEHEVSWVPFFLFQADYCYTDRPVRGDWLRFPDGTLPSDYFRQNCFLSFQEDRVGIRVRDVCGIETLMWGSDYPHTESTFPRSREITGEILADVPQAEQQLILRDNVAKLYGFDLDAIRS
ncbi:MAG: amidohydrolase [Spirochaetaceae bacterium]|nr:amidohydrolase [Myxococcales bacterium]MCB9724804.1 amidohydrolase [Spirochaetaceae bacterium]